MGRDKSRLVVGGATLARRTADLLGRVAPLAVEVGPGVSDLRATIERPEGEGPLVAIVEGRRSLRELGYEGAALVVACDLPLLSERLLRFLAEFEADGSVVPVVRGMPQPLCAKWAARDLDDADRLVREGVRSLRHLTSRPGVVLVQDATWGAMVDEEEFADVDTPEDLVRLGLSLGDG